MQTSQGHPEARRREFWAGVRAQLPILIGVIPFGLIFGVLAVSVGVPPLETQGFSLFVFAGSAQFIAAGLIGDGAAPVIIVLTIFVVNLRHALYSATLAPHLRRLSAGWKLSLSWLMTDEAFAMTSVRYREHDTAQAHWYMLGTGLALWSTWQVSTALGAMLGAQLPDLGGLALDFALPLTFIALLFPMLDSRPSLAAALSAALLAVALDGLPYRIGLLLAAMTGVGVGLAAEGLGNRREMAQEQAE
jgi:4-azaleucine resistance transporter AzlC